MYLIMNLKRTQFAIQDKKSNDLDKANNYPTFTDLMREQNSSSGNSNLVHRRRDLDALG